MKFFPTQLQTYQQCPRKFFYSRDKEIRAKYKARTGRDLDVELEQHLSGRAAFDVKLAMQGEPVTPEQKLQPLVAAAGRARRSEVGRVALSAGLAGLLAAVDNESQLAGVLAQGFTIGYARLHRFATTPVRRIRLVIEDGLDDPGPVAIRLY